MNGVPGLLADAPAPGVVEAVAWPLATLGVTALVHRAGFQAASFDPAAFARARIACPAQVAGAVRKRQAEYFHGRLCAQAALRAAGHAGALAVGTGPMREPVWPHGLVGSITHDATLAAAVVVPGTLCRGIGIDIEQPVPASFGALHSMVLAPAEQALLAVLAQRAGLAEGVLLTLVFSAKESFFKATCAAVGRYFGFDALALGGIDPVRAELAFTVTAGLCADWPAGAPVRIGYACAPHGRVATLFSW